MSFDIEIDWTAIFNQSKSTADDYLNRAFISITQQFGPGYAEKHPELVAAYMMVATEDYRSATITVAASKIAKAIESLNKNNEDY
jgi:hypothetical protein